MKDAEVRIPLDPELLELPDRAQIAEAVAELARNAVLEAPALSESPIHVSRDRRICSGCGRGPFPGTVELWPEVAYWERPRSRRTPGSGSQGVSRHKTGRWLCDSCARRTENGIPLGQGSL